MSTSPTYWRSEPRRLPPEVEHETVCVCAEPLNPSPLGECQKCYRLLPELMTGAALRLAEETGLLAECATRRARSLVG